MHLERPWRDGGAIALALIAALAAVQALGILFQPLLLFLGAVVIATAVSSLASAMERWIPRTPAVLLIYLAVLIAFGLFLWAVVPPLVDQSQMLVEEAPQLFEDIERWLEERDIRAFDRIEEQAQTAVERGAGYVFTAAPTVFGTVIDVFIVLAMSAYLAISAPAIMQFTLSLVPAHRREYARSVLNETAQTMGGYVRGSVMDGVIVAVITYVGLQFIGLDFALVLALLAFLGELIPILGPLLAGAPAVAIALTEGPATALVVLAFYFGIQQFESYVLLPYIMRSQASIPPLLTLFALIAGAAIAGFIGAILAIPLLGGLYILFLRVGAPAIRAWTGAEAAPWQ